MKGILTLAVALATFVPLGFSAAAALPGDLDPTFGSGGKVTARIGSQVSWANAIVIQPDGKIVVGGGQGPASGGWGFGLARFNPDGTLDETFGSGGTVSIEVGASGRVKAVALQADSKIVAAGWTLRPYGGENFALARLNPNGSLDPSFGDGGRVTTDFTHVDEGHAVVVQPDGKIVVAGRAAAKFALARYLSDGSLDPSFGDGGKVLSFEEPGCCGEGASVLLLQSDGKLVAGGGPFVLVRFNPNGSTDRTFGSDGVAESPVARSTLYAAALQSNGKIVAAGFPGLARWKADGTIDGPFGDGGGFVMSPRATIRAVAVQSNGKIVATGTVHSNDGSVVTLARYRSDGKLDRGFGHDGAVTATYGSDAFNDAAALAVQRDGKIVVAGRSTSPGDVNSQSQKVGLIRLLGGNACLVPKVKGRPLAAAKRAITKAGCSPGIVLRRFSAKIKKGRIVAQKPHPGTRVAARTRITLVVSRGRRR